MIFVSCIPSMCVLEQANPEFKCLNKQKRQFYMIIFTSISWPPINVTLNKNMLEQKMKSQRGLVGKQEVTQWQIY